MKRKDPALGFIEELREDTMQRAWGPRSAEERRRIAAAAMIFGRQFDRHIPAHQKSLDEQESRRLLMTVIQSSINEFAESESLSEDEAANFLGEVGNRDLILEFNEVLEIHVSGASDKNLDSLLREAVDSRLDKARWADHWSSG